MIGHMKADLGISTIKTSAFNYDGNKHDFISVEEGRDIFDYQVLVNPCHTKDGEPVGNLNYLVNSRSETIIPSYGVADSFKPIDNVKWYDFFTQNVLSEVPDLKLETVATLHGGGTAILTTNFGDDFKVDGDDSPNKFRLIYANDNTGSSSLQIGLTCVRVVCMNTLALARKEVNNGFKNGSGDAFSVHHTINGELMAKAAVAKIKRRLVDIQNMKTRIERLARINVTVADMTRVLNRAYPMANKEKGTYAFTRTDNIRNEIIHQFESGETAQTFSNSSAWRLFNAMTFRTFNPIRENSRTDRTEIAFRGSMGDISGKVNKLFSIVEQEVVAKAS